ncbi:protein NO VEIN domain-containing protein [Flavobacterium sp. GP15]|uniref:protein NO VEIN domain-containing protein n=1 Tax=Flavobacterium sp. GP15 TaxID=2758567 RepID=UPI00165D7540|nr:DUF3883 domain-containing protein [Flavobacterium sp. GP15]
MINQVHNDSVIGIKKLTSSDLGFADNGVTHIGLFENTLSFLNIGDHLTISSQLIYQNQVFDLLSLLDYIEKPDGSFRSPKIRKGYEHELLVGDLRIDSVVRKLRDIVAASPNETWYLLWLGLDTNELVFLLFKNASVDFNEISNIVGNIDARKQIGNTSNQFARLVTHLNNKIESVNIEYYEELEIASQTGEERVTKRIIPRAIDIEKANALFRSIGFKGEELLFNYFELQKFNKEITDFKWMNQSKETGMPYDFEITNLDNSIVFSDTKSTSYKFELPMILSSGELKFINDHKDQYLIHRLYSINENPKLRVCDNIYTVSDIFLPNFETLNQSLKNERLLVNGIKLAVPTDLQVLNFNNEIIL